MAQSAEETKPVSDQQPPNGEAQQLAPAVPEEQPRVLLHMPVDVRSMTLVVLTVLALLLVLRWASDFFIPLMLGLMLSYALSPVVNALQRLRIPRAISAAVLIVGLLGGAGFSVSSFSDDANQLIESLPEAAGKLRDFLFEGQSVLSRLPRCLLH